MYVPTKLAGAKPQAPDHRGSLSASPECTKRPYKFHRKPDCEQAYQVKQRACLMCKSPFPSAWPGERICKKCKESAAWRSG